MRAPVFMRPDPANVPKTGLFGGKGHDIAADLSPSQLVFYQQRWDSLLAPTFNDECVRLFQLSLPSRDAYGPGLNASRNDEVARAFRFRTCETFGGFGETVASDTRAFPCTGFGPLLPLSLSLEEAQAVLDEMQAERWIDRQTSSITVDVILFNYNVRLFAHVQLIATTSTGGRWKTKYTTNIFRAYSFLDRSFGDQLMTVIFFILLFAFLGLSIRDFSYAARRFRFGGGDGHRPFMSWGSAAWSAFTSDGWWAMLVLNYTLFFVVWGIRFSLLGADGVPVADWTRYLGGVERISVLLRVASLIDGVNCLLCFLRLLYFFRLSPKINVLARTMHYAGDVLGAIVVASIVLYASFAVAGLLCSRTCSTTTKPFRRWA